MAGRLWKMLQIKSTQTSANPVWIWDQGYRPCDQHVALSQDLQITLQKRGRKKILNSEGSIIILMRYMRYHIYMKLA